MDELIKNCHTHVSETRLLSLVGLEFIFGGVWKWKHTSCMCIVLSTVTSPLH